ncbi:hypothetical protein GQ44DRAFT_607306 [Phaeosphaeriaceae sp. PMI808]|nr:hypothetical protein GQ44DRAFT_607306 [Phaeosphaeriaceae sp. PMI808]
MRLTRAAQRAQQNVDEPSTVASELKERAPLNDISPNASPELIAPVEELPQKTPSKSKSKRGGKKGGKGKKAKVAEEENIQLVLEDEQQVAENPSENAAVEGETKESSIATITNHVTLDAAETLTIDERPASPPVKAVRLTRRQLAKQEEELKQSQRSPSPLQQLEQSATEDVAQSQTTQVQEEVNTKIEASEEAEVVNMQAQLEEAPQTDKVILKVNDKTKDANQATEDAITGMQDAEMAETQAPEHATAEHGEIMNQASEALQSIESEDIKQDFIAPSVEITSEPEPKMLAIEKPLDATTSPVMNRTPSRRASRSPSKSPMRIEESFEAIDALEEALENVGKAVSHFDQSTDDKSPRKRDFPKDAKTPNSRAKTPSKTPPASKVSRTPSAVPMSLKPTASSLARATSLRAAPAKEARTGSTDTFDYLASKRRPVSVSFPTPPPPPKGRAPTKPVFQLPSDIVAAKLKAQKEERLKRDANGPVVKQRPISMPPPPKSTKAVTKPNFQLPGEAIAAKLRMQREERQKRETESGQVVQQKARPVSFCMPTPMVKSSKPPTKASFQLPGEAIAARLKAQREERQKREEEAEAAKKAAASKPRPVSIRKPLTLPTRTAQQGVTIPPPPPNAENVAPAPLRSSSTSTIASKRNSIQLSRSTSVSTTASKASNRNSLLITKATVTPVDAAQQKIKGREVFNRDKIEKEAKEYERREKEDAAKQARAQAAERGRIASREWAEKQRRKIFDAVRMKAEAA